MACVQYTLTNVGKVTAYYGYVKCDTNEIIEQAKIGPGQTTNVWANEGSFSIPSSYQNIISVTQKPFPPPVNTTCNNLIALPARTSASFRACSINVTTTYTGPRLWVAPTGPNYTNRCGCFTSQTGIFLNQSTLSLGKYPGNFTYTINFDRFVNNVRFIICSGGHYGTETYTFTARNLIGTAIPNLSLLYHCNDSVNGNVYSTGLPCTDITQCVGDGMVVVNLPTGYNRITVTGAGGFEGTRWMMCLCDSNIYEPPTTQTPTPSVTRTPAATPTRTPSPTPVVCYSNVTFDVTCNNSVVEYVDCCGECKYAGPYSIGTGYTISDCVKNGTVTGQRVTNVVYSNTCVCVPTPTPTPTMTQTPTNTCTTTPSNSPTCTSTTTPTNTPTNTCTTTPSNSPTCTPTNTETSTPTGTSIVETPTPTPTNTETPTPTGTSVIETPTPTPTETETPTPTGTSIIETPTPTGTETPTPTPTTPCLSGTSVQYSITIYPDIESFCNSTGGTPTVIWTLGGFAPEPYPYIPPDPTFFWNAYGNECCTIPAPGDVIYDYLSTGFTATTALGYTNIGLPVECVTPTSTPTPTETETPTPTATSSETPTNTPTPSVTPPPVTGYSFNLIQLPYNFPTTGNTIMNDTPPSQTGTTNPNELTLNQRGIYFNSIDSDGVDRTSYFSQFTGQSITITMTQTGSTAIYSGDTNAFKYWSANTGTPPGVAGDGFVFGTGISVPPITGFTGNTVLIQSATTNWTPGLPVYISAEINGEITPTPTPTNTETPTQTPTATDLSSVTTYTISGCTNLTELVVDLGPGLIIPGDVFYYEFSGVTPSGCYSVVGKTIAPIDDAFTTAMGQANCNDCEDSLVTPTPTTTNTPTPTNTETPTPTPTNTQTPTQLSFSFLISSGDTSCQIDPVPLTQTVYGATGDWQLVTQFFTDINLTIPFNGGSLYYTNESGGCGVCVIIANGGLSTPFGSPC